ncbi:MAG: (Fe-S)-binding protein [Chloroflexi bacterium]|nr:(Fe-S)-binding protein [Chloroflexota bacterium]
MTLQASTVQLFATCLIETLRPEAGMAVVNVLERLGLVVKYPDGQTCCGQPAFNGGAFDDARAMGRHTLDVLYGNASTGGNVQAGGDVPPERLYGAAPIVVPSGSCADMIVHHYPELFAADPVYGPKAEAVAKRTYEFSQFLVDVLGVTDLGARFSGSVAYHPSCHLLRGLGVTAQPRRLLAAVADIEVVEQADPTECCGFGGLFAVKMSDISGAMLKRKLDSLEHSGAPTVVACDVSCLLHIAGGLHRRGSKIETRHLAELLVSSDEVSGVT